MVACRKTDKGGIMMEIKDIAENKPVNGQYLITENQLRTAKNGSTYLAMKISDPTGELAVKIWDADDGLFQSLEVGRVIELNNIHPKTYKDQIQLEWDGKNSGVFNLIPEPEVDYSKFLPKAPGNLTEYWNYLTGVIAAIKDDNLKGILKVFFEDQNFKANFIRVPAALKRHHAYIGGLLEHTAGVTALCKSAADYYPFINQDLLLTGAILHDIGKTKNYKLGKGFDGTNEGKLIGHLVLGVQMVEQAMDKLGMNQTLLRNSLIHLLVSHHGIMEWGSPIEPLTIEACVLHHADNMDAQITKFVTIIREQRPNIEWAPFDPGLGRSIFLGNLATTPEIAEEA
jgi:3'-5' exoribonuclease